MSRYNDERLRQAKVYGTNGEQHGVNPRTSMVHRVECSVARDSALAPWRPGTALPRDRACHFCLDDNLPVGCEPCGGTGVGGDERDCVACGGTAVIA